MPLEPEPRPQAQPKRSPSPNPNPNPNPNPDPKPNPSVALSLGLCYHPVVAPWWQVTRAFGDMEQGEISSTGTGRGGRKIPGLTAEPQLLSQPLKHDDEFVVLATDGLWDVMSPEEVVRIAGSELRESYIDACMRSRAERA